MNRSTDEQRAIQRFLGDRPDAAQWREWRKTLEDRLRRLQAAHAAALPEARPPLESQIAELRKQITALEQEELVTEFVEDSVRVTLAMGSVVDGEQEDAD